MKTTMLASSVLAGLVACALACPVAAQEMPAPHRMPREPVSRQLLEEHQAATPRLLEGPAVIFDAERMRVADTELRLFGVVPPQLGASFGPQARAALDALVNGQNVDCQVRDRDHDGRLMATCHTATGVDMAHELLRRGLAVTARAAIAGSDLAATYMNAEQAAQSQKIGIWSLNPPPAAVAPAAAPQPAPVAVAPTPAAAPVVAHVEPPPVAAAATPHEEKPAPHSDKSPFVEVTSAPSPNDTQDKIAASLISQQAQADRDADLQDDGHMGFFQRYQILIASILMLVTALSIIAAILTQKRRDKRDETRAVAAALRGELMAARGICVGRIKTINSEEDDRESVWPRIRSTLYQAYVGRLGMLGAELSRQVASIYGQASDYASLYGPTGTAYDSSKKNALETLARHIDEVLPKLAGIEQTGNAAAALYYRPRSRYDAPPAPAPTLARPAAQAPALRPAYKTIESTAEHKPTPPPPAPAAPPPYQSAMSQRAATAVSDIAEAVKPTVLWEAVRGFIQNHRDVINGEAHDPHVSEYAEMIEADMARYPNNDSDPFEIPPYKKNV